MERMYFFDSTENDERYYQAADFARFHNQIIGNGVSNTANLPDLEVTARTNMDIALGAGYMFANGYMYENDSTMTLTHTIADPQNDRIDRVIICFDNNPAERKVYAYIKKGVAANSPSPPSLQRDDYVHEMSVAQVRIISGKSYIEQSEITDERTDDDVCGYILLHNIYRGMRINENGLVTMPNQSFVKATNWDEFQYPTPGERTPIPFGTVEKDNQNEMQSDNYTFIPKEDGIYHFWVEMAWDEILENIGYRMYLYKNGSESFPLGARWATDSRDRFFICSGSDSVEKGDEITFVASIAGLGGRTLPPTWFTRIRIAKLA